MKYNYKIEISPFLPTICFILSMIFTVLKLCEVIDWNWFFVFIPLFICGAIYIIVLIIALIVIVKKLR